MRALSLAACGLLLLAGCGRTTLAPRVTVNPHTAASLAAASMGNPVIHVDDNAQPGGDGTAKTPYSNIADAVSRAQALGGGVVVIEPGRYELTSTVRIPCPIDLRGSNVPDLDTTGWPTGSVLAGTETKIVGTAALGANPLVIVGRTDG